jgi:hypothetical protein
MLETGSQLPEATVWTAPRAPAELRDVFAGSRVLVLFYLFDWSAT